MSGTFAEMTTSTPFRGLSHAVKLRHGTDGFTFPPKKGVLRIFCPKNPTASAGCELVNLGNKWQHATSRLPKPLKLRMNAAFPLPHRMFLWCAGNWHYLAISLFLCMALYRLHQLRSWCDVEYDMARWIWITNMEWYGKRACRRCSPFSENSKEKLIMRMNVIVPYTNWNTWRYVQVPCPDICKVKYRKPLVLIFCVCSYVNKTDLRRILIISKWLY
jgi:hypothetical protein